MAESVFKVKKYCLHLLKKIKNPFQLYLFIGSIRVQRFFKNLPRQTELQWKNDDFSVESDAIVIHDEMNMKNTEEWEKLYKRHQEYC